MNERDKKRQEERDDPTKGKFWEKWFSDHDVVWIHPDKQRTVTVNAGRTIEWFNKDYPGRDRLVMTKKIYESDLPRNMTGKIIATSGVTGKDGVTRPKPIGTYYELFQSEDGGYRRWVNPADYGVKHASNQFNKRKNKKVRRQPKRNSR